MPSSYPGSLDTLSNPSATDAMNSGAGHAAQHADANNAIEAIQETLGVDPQGSYDTVAERLDDIVGGGGASTFVASGTFSASTGFNLPDNVFDGTFDDYDVDVIVDSCSADTTLGLRLRASSSDIAGTDYSSQRLASYGGTGVNQTDNLGTDEWQVNNLGASHNGATKMRIYSPNLAKKTSILGQSLGFFSSTGLILTQVTGWLDATTVTDSLAVRPAGGNITGRWTVNGVPKS